MKLHPLLEERLMLIDPLVMEEGASGPCLSGRGVVVIDDLIGKHVARVMAEHLPELILVELEVELHSRLVMGGGSIDVLYLLQHDSDLDLGVVGIGIIGLRGAFQIIVVLLLDGIVDIIIEAIAADAVLPLIIEALIGDLGAAVEDVRDERHCDKQHGKHELHALTVADHTPVA